MKKLTILLILSLTLFSCGGEQKEQVNISVEEYNKLKNIKKPKYPKRVYVKSNGSRENAKYFEVWKASDGHDYQLHIESHAEDQWIHYIQCEKCLKRTNK